MKATVCLHGDWSLGGLTFGDSRIQIKTVRRANRTLKQRLVLLHPCAANASYLFRRDPEESGSGSLGHSKEMKHRGAAPLQGLCNILILVQNVEDILEHNFLLWKSPLAASQRMHFKPFSARKCCQPSWMLQIGLKQLREIDSYRTKKGFCYRQWMFMLGGG